MQHRWFSFKVRRSVIIFFWLAVIGIFLIIYFFVPSLFHQMQQVSYQNTPFVDTPLHP